MPIVEISKDYRRGLQDIADTIASAKKIVVVTGAGISTNYGIPDFRSQDGLYSLLHAQRAVTDPEWKPEKRKNRLELGETAQTVSEFRSSAFRPTKIKGKDLFDAMIWKDPVSTSTFYQFIASLRKTIREDVKQATAAHHFIRTLRDRRKLVRCYTQNIDGLEARVGLSTDLSRGKGTRTRFSKTSLAKSSAMARTLPGGDMNGGCEVVQLHGDLETLRCTLCQRTCDWDHDSHSPRLLAGKAPRCQCCVATDQSRQDRGKRGTKVGTLRPNIILYGEEHPCADTIGALSSHDLTMSPDFLLILGTSLHVHGLKTLVREFAKSVHARGGRSARVVLVNLSKPAESVWKDVIDYWVCMDCDEWVARMRKFRPDIWHIQGELGLNIKRSVGSKRLQAKIPKANHDQGDKENVVLDSEDDPPLSSPIPKVVIKTPAKPKIPLQDHDS
ncbi:MAG: hypothetical protein Q9164_006672, partial [Protoblastenia rupestris]